jgi:5'-3' exonuclease
MPGAEGDDLIFAWSMYLNSIGENSIILTGDQDLIQLVNYNNSTGTYTLWYDNTRSKLVAYPGFNKWLNSTESSKDSVDIFSKDTSFYLVDQIKKEFREFIVKNNLNETEVYCDDFALEKILTGDKSDNIKSVIDKPSKNGDKTFNFSPKKAQNVISNFKKRHTRFSTLYLFEEEYKKEIVQLVSREMKVVGKNDTIYSNLEMNTKLVLLHVNTIPEAIQKSMFDQIKNDTIVESPVQLTTITDRDKLLTNSKYLDPNFNKSLPKGGVGGLF